MFCRRERRQSPLQNIRIEAGAIVTNGHNYASGIGKLRFDDDPAVGSGTTGNGFRRIADEIDQHLLDLQTVAQNGRKRARRASFEG